MDGYINVIICQFVQALLTHKQDLNTIRTFKFDKKWDFKKNFLPERFWHDCHLTVLCQEEGGAQCSLHMPLTDVNCNCIIAQLCTPSCALCTLSTNMHNCTLHKSANAFMHYNLFFAHCTRPLISTATAYYQHYTLNIA